jgi:DNA polymerase IV (archaeal DinB-like DNA polymerase)
LTRVIGHIDLDYFYAQVEEVENPALKSKPVLVCVFSGRTDESGVVATANYRAREFGAKSGMPIVLAKRKLQGKDPALIKMVRSKYESVSERVMEVVKEKVDLLEQTSIDEAFFDITRGSSGSFVEGRRVAAEIKESLLATEGLTSSVGVGQSKAVAKIASDFKKPDGLTIVAPDETESFLNPLSITRLYGVGPKTAQVLEGLGIRTIGQLSKTPIQSLEDSLGSKLAQYLSAASRGQDTEPVSPNQQPTQLSRIITLKQNTSDPEVAFAQLSEAFDDLGRRSNSLGLSFKTVTAVAILTDLTTKTRGRTLESPASDVATIKETTKNLLEELARTAGKEFRRVGVRLSDLSNAKDQTSLSQFLHGGAPDS